MTRTIRPHVLNLFLTGFVALWSASVLTAQEPVEWGEDFVFHTFSIAGVDPVTGESGVAVRDVRAKAHGYFCWYTAGTWLGRIGRAEEQGAIGRQQPVSFNDDALNVRAENAERGEDAELRHARPGPRRAALAATGRHSGAVNNADE